MCKQLGESELELLVNLKNVSIYMWNCDHRLGLQHRRSRSSPRAASPRLADIAFRGYGDYSRKERAAGPNSKLEQTTVPHRHLIENDVDTNKQREKQMQQDARGLERNLFMLQ